MLWLVLTSILAYLIYVWAFKPLNYWKNKKVEYRKPWPIVGSLGPILFKTKDLFEFNKDLYREFPNKRYSGVFTFQIPGMIIRDLDLIKRIAVKDFDVFMNRPTKMSADSDNIISKTLFLLEGQQWRNMRATLSPSFTGTKMKFMFKLIADCAERFTSYFEKDYTNIIEVELKDVSSRFTNDVIATAAFGIETDSLNNPENEFFMRGKDGTDFSGWRVIVFFLHAIFPKLMKFLKLPVLASKFTTFFRRVMKETIDAREQNGIVRPDMVHLLLESRRNNLLQENEERAIYDNHIPSDEGTARKSPELKKHILTDDDIAAQALIFFFAGFDTVSTLSSFMSYELAVNLDVQKRLQKDIDKVSEKCEGKVTYEALMGMKYLDMVVAETLRKWPPAPSLERIAVEDYTIEAELDDEHEVLLEKGTSIGIPVVAIHHDPQYFPNPNKFDPERFSEENKSSVVPFSYMPFGVGPRSCIASRFALMETKILFFHLLSKFNIVPIEKSVMPLKLSKKGLKLEPEAGFWLGFEKRNL